MPARSVSLVRVWDHSINIVNGTMEIVNKYSSDREKQLISYLKLDEEETNNNKLRTPFAFILHKTGNQEMNKKK